MGNNHYKLLYRKLKSDIINCVYEVGDKLPSENELSSKSKIARSTVRNALAQLEKEGYIVKKKGKGSIVSSVRRVLGILDFKGFSASVGNSKYSTESIQEPEYIDWNLVNDFEFSENNKKGDCIRFSRVRYIERFPVMWETSYLFDHYLPGFKNNYSTKNSFFEFIAKEYSIEVIGMNQEIKAVPANLEVANNLNIKINTPVLLIHRKYSTSNPEFHIYSTLYCNTEKYSMSNNTNE